MSEEQIPNNAAELYGPVLAGLFAGFVIDAESASIIVLRHRCGYREPIIAGALLSGIVQGLVVEHRRSGCTGDGS